MRGIYAGGGEGVSIRPWMLRRISPMAQDQRAAGLVSMPRPPLESLSIDRFLWAIRARERFYVEGSLFSVSSGSISVSQSRP